MFRKIAACLVMVTLGVLLSITPAQAGTDTTDPPGSGCSAGSFCVYYDRNYGGAWFEWLYPSVGGCKNIGSPLNDNVSSVINNTSHYVQMYIPSNCGSGAALFAPHTSYPDLNNTGWNDVFSSFKPL
jgi:hypothetical protein